MITRLLKIFTIFILLHLTVVNCAPTDHDFLLKMACSKNPGLSLCAAPPVPHTSSRPSLDELKKRLVVPPPMPESVRRDVADVEEKSFRKIETGEKQNDEIDEEIEREHQRRLRTKGAVTPVDLVVLREKCTRAHPVVVQHCEKTKISKQNIHRCAAYFRDCAQFLQAADPLYGIANAFNSAVNLRVGVEVNGIPYYPVNEEGGIGVEVSNHIPFGSWGGGYSDHVGVRDYWSQYQEVGANWHEGKYGYKNGWSVPLVQSLGVEGGQRNTVSVPLDPANVGKIAVDNGYQVGGYYGHNDHVGVDWRKGHVGHNFGVGVPFAGVGFNTGQAVMFPSIDTFANSGK